MFVGIITHGTEFVVTNSEGLSKCAGLQKVPDDSAYDQQCVEYANYNVEQYVLPGRSPQKSESE